MRVTEITFLMISGFLTILAVKPEHQVPVAILWLGFMICYSTDNKIK